MIAPIVLALLPIVLLIAFGYLMRRRAFLPDAFWPQAERLSYFVLLPCLFVHGLATADLSNVPVGPLAGTLLLSTLVVATLLVSFSHLLADDGPAFTSVFQGGIRFNNYVGVTAALGLFGQPGVALAAVATATIVPTVNILCVMVFARHGAARPTALGVLRGVVTNPLVAACALGIALQLTGIGLPPGLEGGVKALGQVSLPLGLLCVGAALNWDALGQGLRHTINATVAKFALMPLVTAAIYLWFGLDARSTTIAVLFQALPTASSSYIMARQLGGDANLMAGIITFQTALAALTVLVALLLIQSVL
jgi:malonate transporter and related proteins